MPRGGKRPGAGRPKGSKEKQTLEKEAARELVRQIVTANLTPLVKAQIAKALGISFLVTRDKLTGRFIPVNAKMLKTLDPKDVLEVWDKVPDTQACRELFDRALDRPKEQELDVNLKGDWDKLVARLVSARQRT